MGGDEHRDRPLEGVVKVPGLRCGGPVEMRRRVHVPNEEGGLHLRLRLPSLQVQSPLTCKGSVLCENSLHFCTTMGQLTSRGGEVEKHHKEET